ncbi:hypothetical protein [Nocardioides sp. Root140]|uniref:hypothetical protein n=1 Tax=Nocardioides sp. Root140 TaxID=1736460 RepID=UPI0006F68E2C|nr:hypothetical protein [Nocardioides sp. Root140]KQY56711.1 hypothetical protein ASD30_10380 [Nocardioides sp. Root140]
MLAFVVASAIVGGGVGAALVLDDKTHAGSPTDGKDGSVLGVAATQTDLESAYEACSNADESETLTLADEGMSLIVATESEYGPVAGLACILLELDTSEAVVASMDSTTAMMGVQEADDGSIHYQWSYHPDNGINMVITDVE